MKFFTIRFSPLEKYLEQAGVGIHFFRIPKTNRQPRKDANRFVEEMRSTKPDIFWIMKDEHVTPKMLKAVKRVSPQTKIVMWYGDQRGYTIPNLVAVRKGLIDALLITNRDRRQAKIYKSFGIPHVHTFYHSFCPEEFRLWPKKITHQVFFGGSNFKHRKFPLSALRSAFIFAVHNNFKLVVHGKGWPFHTWPWIYRNQYAKELRKAHINLGINHYNIRCYYNRRLFESVASGKLHVTYYIPGMENHFKNHKHLIWFNSVPQGIDLIRYYLKHDREREQIAANGRKFFIKNHSWSTRAKQLVDTLEFILKRKEGSNVL